MMINKSVASLTNEQALIKQAKADLDAFEAIYDFYFAQVYNYTRYRVNDSHTADDLTSEIFESVLKLLQAVSQLSQRECELIALKFTSGLTNRTISNLTPRSGFIKPRHESPLPYANLPSSRRGMNFKGSC